MMTGSVIIVDPYSSGVMLQRSLRRAGFATSAVLSLPLPSEIFLSTFRPGDFDAVWGPVADVSEVLADLARLRPVAVVAGAEGGVELADQLAAELTPSRANVPGLSRARRHKGEMLAAISAGGLPVARSICTADLAEAHDWVEASGLAGADLVIKPAMACSTQGVTLLPGGAGLDQSFRRLIGGTNILGLLNSEVVLQERMVGTEYVVDTFTADGQHCVTDICRYSKAQESGRFAVYESLEFLPFDPAGHDGLVAYVRSVLDALGIRFGPAHTEVMITSDGPRIIEVGARLAGSGLPGACTLATGENGIDRMITCLRGGPPGRDDYSFERHVMIVYFVARTPGTISNVAAYRDAAKLPSCRYLQLNVRDGDQVAVTSDLISTLGLGYAVLAHRDREQLLRDQRTLRELEAAVRIDGDRRLAPRS